MISTFDQNAQSLEEAIRLGSSSSSNIQLYEGLWIALVRMFSQRLFLFSSVTNIKYWMRSDAIIPKTLQLLSDLSVGYPFELNLNQSFLILVE